MGRNILGNLTKAHADQLTPAPSSSSVRKTATAPSVNGLRDGLDRLSTNAVREIDPALIDSDGLQDRLQISPEDVSSLAESIKVHGQQVPILVRPSERQGRFRIVYGRRRLAAIRIAGGPVKAIVRTLDDRAAVLAQGQENNLRLDPSFIEKAVFVQALRAASYSTDVIMDALGVSKQSVSTYEVVLPAIPMNVVTAIGAAHSIGRRKWTELADTVRDHGVDLLEVVDELRGDLEAISSSADRFNKVLKAALERASSVAELQQSARRRLVHRGGQRGDISLNGERIAHYRSTAKSVALEISKNIAPDFGQWLEENADEAVRVLHNRWLESRREG